MSNRFLDVDECPGNDAYIHGCDNGYDRHDTKQLNQGHSRTSGSRWLHIQQDSRQPVPSRSYAGCMAPLRIQS
jgi:hypothetical protein